MSDDLSVVLASNRGPVSFARGEDGFELKRGAGGLAGALDPVARRLGDRAVWIAAATSEIDREALHAGAADGLEDQLGYPVYLLDIEPETYEDYYDVVSNRMLWFANHCLWDELHIETFGQKELDAFRDAYEPVNRRFAGAAAEVSESDSIVLFQDYHLSTAPGYLREMRPRQTIFHFTHSSFCRPGLERIPAPIPRRVIEGMLACDLIGFHTHDWAHSFLDCCEHIGAKVDRDSGLVLHDDRRSWVRTYPITIDVHELRERAVADEARRWAERFLEDHNRTLIVRADRTEPSKNIVRGFDAFGRLLDRRPDLVGRTRFIACLYPSRQTMPEYRAHLDAIDAAVEKVNGRHPGSVNLFLKDDFDRTLGALAVYDVLLVNSIMDGMNLVSKEGPTVNQRDGVLVLSKGAGSHEELGEFAFGIDDPFDIEETARALERAIDCKPDRRYRLAAALRERVAARAPGDWINDQLDDLVAIQSSGDPASAF